LASFVAEAVGFDAGNDPADLFFRDAVRLQDLPGEGRSGFRMTDPSVCPVLFRPPDIVQDCGELQDLEVCFFFFPDP
jgi:hypothetical protein